jgi:chitodextrinase
MFRIIRLLLLLATASLIASCGGNSSSSWDPPPDTVAPSQPGGLVANPTGPTGASLSWGAATDNITVVSYVVSRNGTQVAMSTTTSYIDSGLTPATTYSYRVAAVDEAGNVSPSSPTANVTTGAVSDTTPPSQPTGFTATAAGAVAATLSWNASTDNIGVTGYILSRDGVLVAEGNATSFTDTGLAPATTYAYAIVARDAAGNQSSPASASVTTGTPTDTTPPSQPAGLTGTAASGTVVNLSWSASADNVGVAGYVVTRNGTPIAAPTTTSFADSGLTPATTYSYTVAARDTAGNRSAATSVSVTTPDTLPPSTPTGLTGVASGTAGANLSWNASTDNVGVTDYIVSRNSVQIATRTVTSFADTGLAPATTYNYTVVARDATGNRSIAASVSVTTGTPADTTPPSQPTGLTGVPSGSTGVNLSWIASTDKVGVTGYIVTRDGVQVGTPTATSFADTGLTAGTTHSYTVVARDAAGNLSTAASVSVTISDTVAPSQPGAFTAIATSSVQVSLSWTASTDNVGVTGYIVSRNGVQIATPTARTLTDSGLTPSTTYAYTVVARDAANNRSTAASASATTPAAATANGTVNLAWDAVTAPNLSSYLVYYGTASGTYLQPPGQGLVSVPTTFTVAGLVGGTRYFFVVTAIDSLGNESGFSNEVFADVP